MCGVYSLYVLMHYEVYIAVRMCMRTDQKKRRELPVLTDAQNTESPCECVRCVCIRRCSHVACSSIALRTERVNTTRSILTLRTVCFIHFSFSQSHHLICRRAALRRPLDWPPRSVRWRRRRCRRRSSPFARRRLATKSPTRKRRRGRAPVAHRVRLRVTTQAAAVSWYT